MPANLNVGATDVIVFSSGEFTGSANVAAGGIICVDTAAAFDPSSLNGTIRLFVRGEATFPPSAVGSGSSLDNEGSVTFQPQINVNGFAEVINRAGATLTVEGIDGPRPGGHGDQRRHDHRRGRRQLRRHRDQQRDDHQRRRARAHRHDDQQRDGVHRRTDDARQRGDAGQRVPLHEQRHDLERHDRQLGRDRPATGRLPAQRCGRHDAERQRHHARRRLHQRRHDHRLGAVPASAASRATQGVDGGQTRRTRR